MCCYTGDPWGLGWSLFDHVRGLSSILWMRPSKISTRSCWSWSAAWSRWRVRIGDELGSGVEEPAAFADALVRAVERGGAVAVPVAEEPAVVGGESSHVSVPRTSAGSSACW
jgi:hypothetical protein